jgi:hypothetical protein
MRCPRCPRQREKAKGREIRLRTMWMLKALGAEAEGGVSTEGADEVGGAVGVGGAEAVRQSRAKGLLIRGEFTWWL